MSEKIKGKLIVIEGLDGSGKTTQTDFLIRAFLQEGSEVKTMHFPQHGKFPFGILVDWYLFGKFGDPVKKSPRFISWLYALDRWQAKKKINKWLKAGIVVVLDRYTTSNMGHQLGKLNNETEQLEFLNWLENLEYQKLRIPRPDQVLFLDVDPKQVQKMMTGRERDNDGHEDSEEHLIRTYQAYKLVVGNREEWDRVDCFEDDKLLTPERVHDKVWMKVH